MTKAPGPKTGGPNFNGTSFMVFIFRFCREEAEYQLMVRDNAGLERIVGSIPAQEVERSQSPQKCLARFLNRSFQGQLAKHMIQSSNMPVLAKRNSGFGKMRSKRVRRAEKKAPDQKGIYENPFLRVFCPGIRKLAVALRFPLM